MTKYRYLKVGVAYEGSLDTSYIECLLSRLLNIKGFAIIDTELDMIKAGTAITKLVPVYARRFKTDNKDLIIFLTDGDNGVNTKKQIQDKVNDATLLSISAIGIPEPHLEQWVVSDETAVKNVLLLPGDKPLAYSHMKPKDQLIALHEDSEYEGTLDDAKITIAQKANLQEMCTHSHEFKLFKADVEAALVTISNQ